MNKKILEQRVPACVVRQLADQAGKATEIMFDEILSQSGPISLPALPFRQAGTLFSFFCCRCYM